MTCKDCLSYKVCEEFNLHIPEDFEGIENRCEEFKDKYNFVELKNMKWIQRYRISQAAPPMGGKRKDGWNCSVCGKHSYSRKEVCDGCKTIMWKVEIR